MENKEIVKELLELNVNERTEEKNGLTYLSWSWAWTEILKRYPEATYEICKFENNLPYVYDENTGYMVFTKVNINNVVREMWLPVMDGANKAMLNHEYTYKVKNYQGQIIEKKVSPATMFDINKTIMRCLTKNLSMYGLGLYIYSGEDLPETIDDNKKEEKELSYREQLQQYCEEKKYTEEQKKELSKKYNITAKSTEEDYKKALLNLKVGESDAS